MVIPSYKQGRERQSRGSQDGLAVVRLERGCSPIGTGVTVFPNEIAVLFARAMAQWVSSKPCFAPDVFPMAMKKLQLYTSDSQGLVKKKKK